MEQASWATSFLRILADPEFCSALVRKCPWLTASWLNAISDQKAYNEQVAPFVQEIARQGLINEESMLAKETAYTGFGSERMLSRSSFENWFILRHYNPLGRLDFHMPNALSEGFVSRLNTASSMMLQTAIREREYRANNYIHSVQSAYEAVCRQWGYSRAQGVSIEYSVKLHMGIRQLCGSLLEGLSTLEETQKRTLFFSKSTGFRDDVVDAIASIVYESLACVANEFSGVDDRAWHHAIGIFLEVFPPHASEPVGMNPLQQQLTIKLVDKLKDNLNGWYPAISRVLLATIGPYDAHPQIPHRTAHVILKDAIYKELQGLPALHAKSPEKVADFFPDMVTYDVAANVITHTYSGGGTRSTDLGALVLPVIDLTSEDNWQLPPAGPARSH